MPRHILKGEKKNATDLKIVIFLFFDFHNYMLLLTVNCINYK